MILEDLKKREPFFLEAARKKVNGRRTWVCPKCGNGKGKDGDGISLDPNSKNTPHYKCFRCGLYGDVIDLFRYYKGFSDNSEAFKEFCNYFGDHNFALKNSLRNSFRNMNQSLKSEPESNEAVRRLVEYASENIAKTDYHRGISLETLQRFKIGFVEQWRHPKAPNSQPSSRLIIPTSESSYLARSTVDNSKIKVGNVHIFNIDAIRTAQQPIFIVEGEIDALSIIDVGGEAIALGGVSNIGLLVQQYLQNFAAVPLDQHNSAPLGYSSDNEVRGSESGKDMLAQRNTGSSVTLVLALDNDKAGEEATEKLAEELRQRNIPFYRADALYGDFKDANEVLAHSRDDLKGRVEKTLQDALNWQERAISLERELYLKNSAESYVDDFINGVHDRACTACIPTGFRRLDEVLDGGLFEGLYVFGAISSLGKTTFVLQIADQIAQQGQDVLIFSLEMARTELMAKSISRLTLLSGNHRNAKTTRGITMGSRYADYSVQELETIENAVERYREYARNIFIHEGVGDIGTAQIRSEIERHIRVMGTKPVVVIDYVQILAPADIRATDKQNTDKAVLELKRISRDFKLPILGISSFNRMSYREAVTMSAFKESGSLEYGSDVLIGLQLKGAGEDNFDVDVAKQADPRKIEVVILKNRNGATGKHIDFDFYAKFNCFEEKGGWS